MNQKPEMNTIEYRQQNKSARQLQDEIRLMRLAYRDQGPINEYRSQPRFVAWFCLAVFTGGMAALYFLLTA